MTGRKTWRLEEDPGLTPRMQRFLSSLKGPKFKYLLEIASKHRATINAQAAPTQRLATNVILNSVADLHPFVINATSTAPITADLLDDEIDLPFQTCSFEMSGSFMNGVVPLPRADEARSPEPQSILCSLMPVVIVHEFEPRHYHFMAFEAFDDTTSCSIWTERRHGDDRDEELRLVPILSAFLKSWIHRDAGSLSVRPYVHLGHGRQKKTTRPQKVVFIGDRPSKGSAPITCFGGSVDWSHKWEVRGHWRAIKGIGKDRSGDYGVTGYTWVIPHTKGDGVLLKKTRIIEKYHGDHA